MTPRANSSRAAVAAPHRAACDTGERILKEGGNAVQAMVAMAATIAVVYPHMNSIGGDGFWLIRYPDGRVSAIEACGPAGQNARIETFAERHLSAIPPHGAMATITVPGAVGGWQAALESAVTLSLRALPLSVLFEDAIGLARGGYETSASESREKLKAPELLRQVPGFCDHYFIDGKQPAKGTIRREPELASTFEYLARHGLDDFYRGEVARSIAGDLARLDGLFTLEDMQRYRPAFREPLSMRYRNAMLYNFPPPTQGLASLILLGLFSKFQLPRAESFEHIHLLVEASKRALITRDAVVTDFEHLTHEPSSFLEDKWLASEAAKISRHRAAQFPPVPEDGGTIWMGAIDDTGLAVSYIQSVFWEYGSGCRLPTSGVLLQNRGTSFSLDPKARNPLVPGRRPFHTLNSPLAVFDDGRICSYGSMGGAGQPQFQAQVFTRYADYGYDPDAAVSAPRFLLGQTWGEPTTTLKVESRFDPTLISELRSAEHQLEELGIPYFDGVGHAGLIVRHSDHTFEAAHDPRADGGGRVF